MTPLPATFGRALRDGAESMVPFGVAVRDAAEWACLVFQLESAGTWSPDVLNGLAKLVPASGPKDLRPEVVGSAPDGAPLLRLSHGSGARGIWQKMPAVLRPRDAKAGVPALIRLYGTRDLTKQCEEAFTFWRAMVARFTDGVPLRHVGEFYCLNFLPARLKAPRRQVILADGREWPVGSDQARVRWSEGYVANRNLDLEGKGYITLGDLQDHLLRSGATSSGKIRIAEALRLAGL